MNNSIEIQKWWAVNGDNTLRLDYDLTKDSVVIDLGGYKGEWANKIYTKYDCHMIILEPVERFFNQISGLFGNDKKVHVYNFGIGESTREEFINLSDDASSTHTVGSEKELIKIYEAIAFIGSYKIDLMKINIEGGEYELLEHLIKHNKHLDIKNIQIQWHTIGDPDYVKRHDKILEDLSKTHETTYRYDWVWENWKLKS